MEDAYLLAMRCPA